MREVLEMLQDTEEKAFDAFSRETDRFKKARYKLIDEKLKDLIKEVVYNLKNDKDLKG